MKLKKLLSAALAAAVAVSSVRFSAAASTVSITNGVETTVTESVNREYLAVGDKSLQDGLLFTELEDGTYEVGYNYYGAKPVGTVVIPESVNGRLVTRIADAGFANCSELVSVVVPNCVISVGTNAFYGTKFLDNQEGPIKYAGKVAVYCDHNVTAVTIAPGTLGLADKLFYRSPELVSADLPEGLLNLGSMTFNDCQKLTTVNIPNSIKTIGSGVFADCKELRSINIPNGVKSIGAYAFYRTALSNITIPESVTKIGKGAFEDSSLNTNGVTIGGGYINIGGRAFNGTPFYGAQGNIRYAGNVFLGCGGNVTEATLKDGTTAIADMALSGHMNITSVTIPSSVKTIGEDAFFNCPKLAAITIPEGVESIGEDAFRLCDKLASVSLPMSVKTIGQGAFYGCPNLKTVSYPGSAVDWAAGISMGSENDSLLNVQPTLGKGPKTPDPVTGATVTDTGSNSVSLSWNKSSIADNYRVDALINGNWITLGKTNAAAFTAKNLAAYTEYHFRIYALARNILSTPVEISARTRVAAVSNVNASSTPNSVTLSWAAIPNVDYYVVNIFKDGQWQMAGKTSNNMETSVTVGGLNEKTTYQFKIWAYKGSEYGPSVSVNAVTAAIIYPDTVTGLTAYGSSTSSITLSWNPTSTADSYEIDIYRNGKWVYVAKTSGSSYTVSGLSVNTSYDFKVFSFKGSNYSSSARISARTRGSVLAPSINYTIAPENVKPAELSNTQVMMKGIDVSGWQGEIDFRTVKSSGIDFVIVKAGEGDIIVDTWEKNYKNAKEAGLMVGAYWYCTSTTIDGAIQEAQRFIGALNGKKLDFPVYLDMETMGQFNNGKAFCTQLVEAFCSELEKAGYCAGVYCSTYWYTNFVDDNVRMKRPNWVAQHDNKCYYNGGFGIWQFDADAVPGIQGNCDRNWGYYDYSGYIKSHKLNGCQ